MEAAAGVVKVVMKGRAVVNLEYLVAVLVALATDLHQVQDHQSEVMEGTPPHLPILVGLAAALTLTRIPQR